jgi:glutathione S-transferase
LHTYRTPFRKISLQSINSRGRAEGIRKLLHYKNVPYEEVLIGRDEWPKKKNGEIEESKNYSILEYKYGQVPALEVDGKFLYQSNAIIRYLARKYSKFPVSKSY